jgi:hypothetical protein
MAVGRIITTNGGGVFTVVIWGASLLGAADMTALLFLWTAG